jgi:DNA helicase-2/ATP-dependent DNA helicase PcrA
VDPERLLDDLDAAQREAVTTAAAPLRVLAGAGSGKTRVLTRRVAHRVATGSADPRRVLVLTFTRKAAGELHGRLRALGLRDAVTAGTFHAVAYAQLRARWEERRRPAPEVIDRRLGVLRPLVPRGTSVVDVATELDWASARDLPLDDYPAAAAAAGRRPGVDPDLVVEVGHRYARRKAGRRLVDFDDLLRGCRDALRDDPEFAAAQRWWFQHLLVDEFQDVNPLQLSLVRAWVGGRDDLCVVGDPHQAIYGWNGGDPGLLTSLERWFPGVATVVLDDNHRSTPQVLAAAAAVLGPAATRPGALRAHRPDGPEPTVHACDDERAEAAHVARAVRDLHAPGARWSAQAVLVRTNAQTAVLAEALRQAGVPHRVRGGSSLLDRSEVTAALDELRRRPDPFSVALDDLAAELGDDGDHDDGHDDGHHDDGDHDDGDAARERRAALGALVALGREYQRTDPRPSAEGFAGWLRTAAAGDGPDTDAVELATFHAAKGLEWPIVHLAGLEAGYVPIGHARTEDALAEERRLLHVAVTRAERVLRCTWARQRTLGDRVVGREPSPLLRDLAAAGTTEPTAPAAQGLAAARAEVATTASAEPPSVGRRREALRAWRTRRARAAAVAESAVLDDATLEAIVVAAPRTRDELAAVDGVGPIRARRLVALVDALAGDPTVAADPRAGGEGGGGTGAGPAGGSTAHASGR